MYTNYMQLYKKKNVDGKPAVAYMVAADNNDLSKYPLL